MSDEVDELVACKVPQLLNITDGTVVSVDLVTTYNTTLYREINNYPVNKKRTHQITKYRGEFSKANIVVKYYRYSLTHLLTHSPTHSLTYLLTHLFTHS